MLTSASRLSLAIASQNVGRFCRQWQNLGMPNPLLRFSKPAKSAAEILSALQSQNIVADPVQRDLVELLARSIHQPHAGKQNGGVYVYGPPGRGKTLIINTLVSLLPTATTARFHFHEFFQQLNSPANRISGQPLGAIFAQGLQRELLGLEVLVFDEFHCTEPGDAMFMAKLVKHCMEHDILLITTSNYEPEKLLDDDAFHHLVQPTIQRIRRDFSVLELDHAVDYRRLASQPNAEHAGYRRGTLNLFPAPQQLPSLDTMLEIGYDKIGPVHAGQQSVWITFDQICRTRRNTADYLELATRFACWHIIRIPSSATMPMDEERRLANLIDIFYDKNLEVHLYAEDDLSGLGHMLHDIEKARLTSRLGQLQLRDRERIDA